MRRIALIFSVTVVLVVLGCTKDASPGGDSPAESQPTNPLRTEVPGELVGTWVHGSIDFALWENYKEGYYAGRNATPTREAMVIGKDGTAKFYRYAFAFGLYEELIDCEGTVTVHGDQTFTFSPSKGRKRFFNTRHPANNKDRPLTDTELSDPKLAGKRNYAYVATANPVALRITVPGSAPYNWYKKP